MPSDRNAPTSPLPDSQTRSRPSPNAELTLTRRSLLRRAAAFGAAAPIVVGLLAACGSGSSSSPTTTTASGSGSTQSTGTSTSTSSSGASGTPGSQATAGGTPNAATNGNGTTTTGGTSFAIEPAKHKGGKLIAGVTGDAQTANPLLTHDSASSTIINMMFEGVMQSNPKDATPMGLLAKSWNISADGTTYSFVLQSGVKFHDGQPFSANDVKFTYDLFLNPDTKSPRTSTLAATIKSVDVQDDTHVTFTLKQPNASFLASNMGYGIVPQHILKDVPPAQIAQNAFSTGKKGVTIGTGPFMFEEWVKDDHVTVSKFTGYWRGEPYLDQWIYKVVPNQTVLTQQLKTGEADYGTIQPADVASMQQQSNVTVHIYSTFTETFYSYQMDPSKSTVFQDKEVRQALLYALDRKAMVEAIDFGYAEVAVGTIPPISWAFNPDGITLKYPYDMEKAKSLLDQAGWKVGSDGIREKNGKKLSFTVLSSTLVDSWQQYVTVFQQQWKQLGADVKPNLIEWNAFLTKITSEKSFDLFFESFGWGVDPDETTWYACSAYNGGLNRGKYCNPQVDKLLADALATTDQAKRKQIYTQFQNVVMDDLPYVVLDFPKGIVGVNKRMHNYFPNTINTTFDAYQWWVDA